jgi:hypothetical protein
MSASVKVRFCVLVALAVLMTAAAPAFAQSSWWHLTSGARPTNLAPGQTHSELVVTAQNLGDSILEASKAPVHITDDLPAGLRATGVTARTIYGDGPGRVPCTIVSQALVSCTFSGEPSELPEGEEVLGGLAPYHEIEIRIPVAVEPSAASGELNEVSVSGGEAPAATVKRPIIVSNEPTPFGVEAYEFTPEEANGAIDTQAGSHPFQVSFDIGMNQEAELPEDLPVGSGGHYYPEPEPAGLTKDLRIKLPTGFVGNPRAVPQCSIADFLQRKSEGEGNDCAAEDAVGVATVNVNIRGLIGIYRFEAPVFNLPPSAGEPARFGFYLLLAGLAVYIDSSVRTGGDYGITASVDNIAQTAAYISSNVILWGVPGDPRHDGQRGWECLLENSGYHGYALSGPCVHPELAHPAPFLDLPTSCTGPLQSSIEADSWQQEGVFDSRASEPMPALDGCNKLPFVPEIKVTPDGQQASRPTGLNVDVHVPQEGQLNGAGLAQSNIKNIVVKLPEGVTLNPSSSDGLQACSESQVGYLPGESQPPSELHFTPKLPGSFGTSEQLQPGVNFCPNASKIATVKVKTPLLPNALEGAVYLMSPQNFAAPPQENPFESLVGMYLVAEDPVSGTLVKLPGRVALSPATGQIEATFENNPQLPFEDAELHFFGGERAPLASPARCGTYTTTATYTPWSGGEAVHSSSSFEVISGPNGTPCPGASLPFGPSLSSGTTNINAGSFSELTTTLSREDGQQSLQSVTLHYPAGVSGLLAGVKLCGEAEANAGSCGPESQIGETIVSVGLGGDPFTVTGGKVYITGPYEGAPFGLSIVNPAKAGPFDLQEGRPVVVRAKVEVDPHTAALTVRTDPPGSPHAIPTIVEGIPLDVRHVNVLINRPGFTFNPTNCDPSQITGAIDSAEGASYPVADPFQVTNCAVLGFAPKFTAATAGKTSRTHGASLGVKLSYPKNALGTEANIARVKVELPKALPSRLTTLQKACTAGQFNANPAGCPAASIVGHAKAITPLVPVPLEGPAYFVSNGNESFPNLIVVLQGYGVTIDLVGDTFIGKTGITSSTFKTVPDAPVGSFELNLPEGNYSALAANGNLCKKQLTMPTEFVAQSGTTIHQSTKITVSGCPRVKAAKKTKHPKKTERHHPRSRKKGAKKK